MEAFHAWRAAVCSLTTLDRARCEDAVLVGLCTALVSFVAITLVERVFRSK